MKNVHCVITNEASTLKMKISIETEIVLQSLALTSIIAILKEELNSIGVQILEELFAMLDNT